MNTTVRFSGGRVWLSGTVASGASIAFIGPLPRAISRYRCPTRFWYLIEKIDPAGIRRASSTLNATSATSRSTSWTSVTWPTRTPAMRTSLPGMSPEASEKRAE